jgi:hypothetical protein
MRLPGRALLMAAALAASCAKWLPSPPAPTAPIDELACRSDDDCVVTTRGGCCACRVEPYAINREALAKRTDICATIDCKCAEGFGCGCPHVPSAEGLRGICADHQCQLEPRR